MISKDEKCAYILHDLGKNFPIFLEQARIKLFKQRKICDKNSYMEMVSDVVFSVIDKLKTTEVINRFYDMAKSDKLRLYILKGVSTNSSYVSSPFLQKKLKENNKLRIFDNYDYFIEIESPEEIEEEEIRFATDISTACLIKSMLEKPKATLLFGDDWKYYTMLFKEYVSTNSSYQTLADKYHIPRSSISFHIRQVKNIIKKELNIN